MQRLLPAFAAFALVTAGLVAGLLLLTARDRASIGGTGGTTDARRVVMGPAGLPVGNVLIEYAAPADGRRIRHLATRLGATDGEASRAAGQAVVTKRVPAGGVRATTGDDELRLRDARDPQLADFVRDHLGRGGR